MIRPISTSIPRRPRDVSPALSEVRTVLKRAKTAIKRLESHPASSDPDSGLMIEDLEKVVETLSCWRRTGR